MRKSLRERYNPQTMNRRSLLKALPLGAAAALPGPRAAHAALPKMKITRVRYYKVKTSRPIFNQSSHIVTIETDAGITGIGEGGHPDSIEQLAGLIIGENPARIEHLWQLMYRHYFYPPGREKVHALGAIDLALWDIKGKALGVPVYELLGGLTRNYVECYSTGFPSKGSLEETARACIDFGFRAFRTGAGSGASGDVFNARKAVDETFEQCQQIRTGVGENGDWAIDFHTRFDFPDAVRLADLIAPLRPIFVEDLVRSENPEVYRTLRPMVKVPIAVGEQFGDRWDLNMLVENQLMDFSRVTLPNSGGITEFMKIAAICETHYVGLVPHFTGPVAEAALVHTVGASSGPGLMEMTGDGSTKYPHLPEVYDFRQGKMWPNERPGLGVTFDASQAEQVLEVTEQSRPIPLYQRRTGR
ncbi:MAG: mandelate racemase/muconate lactonizing enzyme family protein [Bryobacterales bacterium]